MIMICLMYVVTMLGYIQANKSQYRTLTKTRTYMRDGEMVTERTQRIVLAGEENKTRIEHDSRYDTMNHISDTTPGTTPCIIYQTRLQVRHHVSYIRIILGYRKMFKVLMLQKPWKQENRSFQKKYFLYHMTKPQ